MNLYGFCFNNIFSWFDYLGREAMPVDVTVYPKIKDKPDKPGTPIGNDPAEGNIDKIMKELKEPPYRIPDEMIPVNNLVDANQKLKDLSKKDCCIKTLTFEGHGNSGRQIIGNVNDSTGNWIGMTKDKNGKYVPNGFEVFRGVTFCKPCSIYLRGCNTGKGINERWGTNEPREFATALARATGCNVFGFLTLCYPASGGRTHPPGTYSPEHLGSPSGDPNTNLEELIGRQNPIQNPNK